MAFTCGTRTPVVLNRQVILLDNKTIAAHTLLRISGFNEDWSAAALNYNIGVIGGRRVQRFSVEDLRNITTRLHQVHPGFFAKVQKIYTKLIKEDAIKYKEVKKACVFIWCGGLHSMTFHNESLTSAQLLGTMNAIIEASCFFFGGPEYRSLSENTVAVSQSFDKYRVSRWKAADECAKYDAVFPIRNQYDAVFPIRNQYEGDIDIDKGLLYQPSSSYYPVGVSSLAQRGRITNRDKGPIPPWKLIDLITSPFLNGSIPKLPLRHWRSANTETPHGARAIEERLLPLYYPRSKGRPLQFNVYKYLVYGESSSDKVDFLSEQLKVLSEQHGVLSQCLYDLSSKIEVSEKQRSCLTMHFPYTSKSTPHHSVWDLHSRSWDLHRKLVDPLSPLQDRITQLNRFWVQYQTISAQFEDVRGQFDQPFPVHDCDVCGDHDGFPKFARPLSYEELLGCGEGALPAVTGPFEGPARGYCLTAEQLEKLMESMSTDPDSEKAEPVIEEQIDTAPPSTTKGPNPPQVVTQFEEQLRTAPTYTTQETYHREAATRFEEQHNMAPTNPTMNPNPRETAVQREEQHAMAPASTAQGADHREAATQPEEGDKLGTSTANTQVPDLDQDTLDCLQSLLAGDDAHLAAMLEMDSSDLFENYPEPPPGYTRVVDSAPVSYGQGNHERTVVPDTAPKRPAKRRRKGDGAASSSAGT